MIVLASTDSVRVVTTSANAVDVVAAHAVNAAAAFTPTAQLTAIAAAATTTVVTAPAATTTANISSLSFRAKGGANTLTVQLFNGTAFEICQAALNSGDRLEYENGHGWTVTDSNGATKTVAGVPGPGTIPLTSLATQAANTIVANATAGVASPAAFPIGAEEILGRSAGNITTFASAVQSILMRAAGSLFFATAAANQVLRRSGAGDLGFGTLVSGNIGANQVTNAELAQMAANSIKANATAALANATDVAAAAAQFLGRSLTGNLAFQLKGLVASNTTMPAATNATTNLTCGGSFSIPANTLEAGAVYRVTGMYHYVHTAAVTPTITVEFLINAAVIAAVTLVLTPIATASNYTGTVQYILRCQTTGAGGTCVVAGNNKNSFVTFARASIENIPTAAPATTAIDTTVARTIELRMRMTTAVAANTLTVVHGFVEKL